MNRHREGNVGGAHRHVYGGIVVVRVCVCGALLADAGRFKELPQGLSMSIVHNACSADNIF